VLGEAWLQGPGSDGVLDQADDSTDLLFQDRQALADLYPRRRAQACLHFSAQDLLRFLGRRLHPRCDGAVRTDGTKDRGPGARLKHRVQNHWRKREDTFGHVLRSETVLNNPRAFTVRRRVQRQGQSQRAWCPRNKGVANFYHEHDVAQAAHARSLSAVAVVDRPQARRKIRDRVQKPARRGARRRRGLPLLRAAEQKRFRAVLRGEPHVPGFRNRASQAALFPARVHGVVEQRRRTAPVARWLH
jgi:hypothetical protein